ncbi:cytidylyltransferase domain-containing protein [Aeromonas rivipollensis]|uniref:acylneuraminate cytidylyltransferase family protein n=1 Tax=Aeromonas rivipollensis TaxID=948519 RepID=UPI003D1F4BB9
MKKIAIIPAKSSSSRVNNKNFRPFHGDKSLLEIKIEQCISSMAFDDIYVSSDSTDCSEIASKYGVRFIERDIKYCIDDTPWSEVLIAILEQTDAAPEDLVAWVPVTTPLFSDYSGALSLLLENSHTHDSLMTVTQHKHYMLNSDFIPCNFQFGVWASYSQLIKPYYQMNCALWMAPKGKMIRNRFQTGDAPYFMVTPMLDSIDIDEPEEFELAQILFKRKYEN